jgi:hypothetical protein
MVITVARCGIIMSETLLVGLRYGTCLRNYEDLATDLLVHNRLRCSGYSQLKTVKKEAKCKISIVPTLDGLRTHVLLHTEYIHSASALNGKKCMPN